MALCGGHNGVLLAYPVMPCASRRWRLYLVVGRGEKPLPDPVSQIWTRSRAAAERWKRRPRPSRLNLLSPTRENWSKKTRSLNEKQPGEKQQGGEGGFVFKSAPYGFWIYVHLNCNHFMLRGAKGFRLPSEILVTPRIYLGCKLPLSHMSSKGRKSVRGPMSRMSLVARTATCSRLSETVPVSAEEHRVGLVDIVIHILTFYAEISASPKT